MTPELPPHPYSTRLFQRIVALTDVRDEQTIDIYRSVPDSAARREQMDEVRETWRAGVLAGCIEALEHAETLVENLKKMDAAIRETRARMAAVYPEGGQ